MTCGLGNLRSKKGAGRGGETCLPAAMQRARRMACDGLVENLAARAKGRAIAPPPSFRIAVSPSTSSIAQLRNSGCVRLEAGPGLETVSRLWRHVGPTMALSVPSRFLFQHAGLAVKPRIQLGEPPRRSLSRTQDGPAQAEPILNRMEVTLAAGAMALAVTASNFLVRSLPILLHRSVSTCFGSKPEHATRAALRRTARGTRLNPTLGAGAHPDQRLVHCGYSGASLPTLIPQP